MYGGPPESGAVQRLTVRNLLLGDYAAQVFADLTPWIPDLKGRNFCIFLVHPLRRLHDQGDRKHVGCRKDSGEMDLKILSEQ